MDTDHAPVCVDMRMRFVGRPRRRCDRIDTSQLTKPAVPNAYRSTLTYELSQRSLETIEGHWLHVYQTLIASGKSSCGMSHSQHGYWVSSRSLELIDAHRPILEANAMKLAKSSGQDYVLT
ncbi:unnamed protein product [Dicrocoelium dendriticum]|nr:unnamed protein product [Dicrocoelium dendriticum]